MGYGALGIGHWALGMGKRQGRQGRWGDKAETCSIIPPCPPCLLTAAALAAQSPIPNSYTGKKT
ncbi:MAG: hypothetical protein V7K68_13720 [Nostoc sp.]|uniref:hypothetical protein n=1 Tax=Nostoc sp. TaxID=1180 RepID=UPI002FF4E6EE